MRTGHSWGWKSRGTCEEREHSFLLQVELWDVEKRRLSLHREMFMGSFALGLWLVGFGELGLRDVMFKGRRAQSCLQLSHRKYLPAPRYSRDGNEGPGFG